MLGKSINIFIQYLIAALIILATVFCVFPLDYLVYKVGGQYTVHVMLAFFGLGFVFLLLRNKELMYVSFICCGLICAFLQDSFDDNLLGSFYPKPTEEMTMDVAHFNVSSSESDYQSTVETILETNADIVSIQEVTPDWNMMLQQGLKEAYPYNKTVVRIDFHGMAVYSKFPFERVDTFHFQDIPNIFGSVKPDSTRGEVFFVSSHMTPPLNYKAYENLGKHLKLISEYVRSFNAPAFAIGDYNVVPWSEEIKSFRSSANLINARKDFTPDITSASMRFFQSPIDHIFFSDHFQCLTFNNIEGTSANHLGISGRFQFKFSTPHVKGSL
ncbi:MAG: endonuclease/exonuclease/phosphatase family protein [Bacteroidota bacterium]